MNYENKLKNKTIFVEESQYASHVDNGSLELAVENKRIAEFSDKYRKRVLNEGCNPINKVKKIEYRVKIETKDELPQEKIKQLDAKFEIKR